MRNFSKDMYQLIKTTSYDDPCNFYAAVVHCFKADTYTEENLGDELNLSPCIDCQWNKICAQIYEVTKFKESELMESEDKAKRFLAIFVDLMEHYNSLDLVEQRMIEQKILYFMSMFETKEEQVKK